MVKMTKRCGKIIEISPVSAFVGATHCAEVNESQGPSGRGSNRSTPPL